MIVGTLQIKLLLSDARTLKDKRSVLASLKSQVRNRFNVSIAEVDHQDMVQSATLGVAQVSNDTRYVNGALDKLVDFIRAFPAASLVDYRMEFV